MEKNEVVVIINYFYGYPSGKLSLRWQEFRCMQTAFKALPLKKLKRNFQLTQLFNVFTSLVYHFIAKKSIDFDIIINI